ARGRRVPPAALCRLRPVDLAGPLALRGVRVVGVRLDRPPASGFGLFVDPHVVRLRPDEGAGAGRALRGGAGRDRRRRRRPVDGFVSYGSERHDGQKLMPALGTRELRFGALVWGHGGAIPGALGLAASAIVSGQAEVVAVYRSLAENAGARLRVAVAQDDTSA